MDACDSSRFSLGLALVRDMHHGWPQTRPHAHCMHACAVRIQGGVVQGDFMSDFSADDVVNVDVNTVLPLVQRVRWLDQKGNGIASRAHNHLNQVTNERIDAASTIGRSFAAQGVHARVGHAAPRWDKVVAYESLASPMDFDFHVKSSFRAGSIHDPAVQPFVLHMCSGHPLGWLCGPIVKHGLDLPAFFEPWGGDLFGVMHARTSAPPKAVFRNSKKCGMMCDNGQEGWSFVKQETLSNWNRGLIGFVDMEPQVVNGLTLELSKPRLCMASVFVNLYSKLPYDLHFRGLPGIVEVLSSLSLIVTFDAISAFSHISLTERSLPYAAFQVPGLPLAVYLTMWFGWRPACHVMQAFSTIVADYITVHHSIPVVMHIDDGAMVAPRIVPGKGEYTSLGASDRFRVTANAAYIVLMIFRWAGFCIGLPKSSPLPEAVKKFLGLMLDCPAMSYCIPLEKVEKYHLLLMPMLHTPLGDLLDVEILAKFNGFINYLALACVPLKVLSKYLYRVAAVPGLRQTTDTSQRFRFLREILNEFDRAPFRPPDRALLCLGTHDSSSHTIGAWLCLPDPAPTLGARAVDLSSTVDGRHVYVSAPLPARFLLEDIDVKEFYSLLALLVVIVECYDWVIRRYPHIVVLGDNMHVLYSMVLHGRGSIGCLEMTEEIVLYQLRNGFHLSYGRITTQQNTFSDMPSRYIDRSDVQLLPEVFAHVWRLFGPFDFDGMASERTTQCDMAGRPLPFFSKFLCPTLHGMRSFQFLGVPTACYAVDFFQQTWAPFETTYVFPPFEEAHNVLRHVMLRSLDAVVLVYDEPMGYLPRFMSAAAELRTRPHLIGKARQPLLRFWHHKTFTQTRDVARAWMPLPGGLPFDLYAVHLPFSRRTKRMRSI